MMLDRRRFLFAVPVLAARPTGGKRTRTRTMQNALAPAHDLIERAVAAGTVASAVLQVQSRDQTHRQSFGRAHPDTVFLLASITKPMTAAAVVSLVEAGKLALDEPAQKYVPELAGPERARITVRSLLDHSSGLPDMPPDNRGPQAGLPAWGGNKELRLRHAPLADFLGSAVRAPLLFPPGSAVRYQSMGFLIAATIVERITGLPLREHLQRRLFAPLGMKQTSLGLGGRSMADTASCQVPDDPGGWNTTYWRDLGSPWGGAHGTAADLVRLLHFFAHPAADGPLRPETVKSMLTPSGPAIKKPAGAAANGRPERYGLGWRLGMGGKGSSERTFGHSGATGVTCWMDPERELTCVLLTTWPSAQSQAALLGPVSDRVAEAFRS
jgi:CubicO group peptidase (beta-lactamase class C family)